MIYKVTYTMDKNTGGCTVSAVKETDTLDLRLNYDVRPIPLTVADQEHVAKMIMGLLLYSEDSSIEVCYEATVEEIKEYLNIVYTIIEAAAKKSYSKMEKNLDNTQKKIEYLKKVAEQAEKMNQKLQG